VDSEKLVMCMTPVGMMAGSVFVWGRWERCMLEEVIAEEELNRIVVELRRD
jgi:hypothetical protein